MTQGDNEDPRDLLLRRRMAAPRAAIWRCWTEPELLMQWFTPPPWRTTAAVIDLLPGGTFSTTMEGPSGERMQNPGVILEVIPRERLVFTDAYVDAWTPSEKPFMTGIVKFSDADGGGTDYHARVRHWSAADCKAHEEMGFHDGWGKAAEQLEALAASL